MKENTDVSGIKGNNKEDSEKLRESFSVAQKLNERRP